MLLLRRTELHDATEQSRQAAIAWFYDGGELHRLLHPQTPTMHSPMLRTSVPDSFVVAGDGLSLQTVALTFSTLAGSTFNSKGALSRSQEFDLWTFSL